jgi:hypothetical protein
MIYVIVIGILAAIVCGIVKLASTDRYSSMTEEEFEAEAQRSSLIGGAMIGLQKVIDPGHRADYVHEQKQRIEAEDADSGDRPEAGPPAPSKDPPRN